MNNVNDNRIDRNSDLNLLLNTSLVDIVTEKIRNNIYTGKYKAGQKLIVRELSAEFGVSHTPIKDALNRLIAEGYVESLPRRSVVVRTYTSSELIDSLQARLMCEIFFSGSVIRAAKTAPEIVSEMKEALMDMQHLLQNPEHLFFEDWIECERRFHFCYMKYCGNNQIFKFYQELDTNKTSYFAYLNAIHSSLPLHILRSNIVEHKAIIEAIAALNTNQLIAAVICHILHACENFTLDDECRIKVKNLKESLGTFLQQVNYSSSTDIRLSTVQLQ